MKDATTAPSTQQLHHDQSLSRALQSAPTAATRRASTCRMGSTGRSREPSVRQDLTVGFELVRHIAKDEAPLGALARNLRDHLDHRRNHVLRTRSDRPRCVGDGADARVLRQFRGSRLGPRTTRIVDGHARHDWTHGLRAGRRRSSRRSEAPPQDYMTRVLISRMATVAGVLALASACTMKDQEAPPLTGPSEFGQSIVIAVSPDVLPQDGASQSFITVTARDAEFAADSQPDAARARRASAARRWTSATLSARSVVTGSDGKATLVYTAPPSPAVSPDAVPPGRHRRHAARHRLQQLHQSGARRFGWCRRDRCSPPTTWSPYFTVTPASPTDNQTVLFDASGSHGPSIRDRVIQLELRRRRPRRRHAPTITPTRCPAPMS